MYLVDSETRFMEFYTQMTEVDEAIARIAKQIKDVKAV